MFFSTLKISNFSKTLTNHISRSISFVPRSKHGGRQIVTCIPSLPEPDVIMDNVRSVLFELGAPVDLEVVQLGARSLATTEKDLEIGDVQYAVTTIRRNGAALMSHMGEEQLASNIAIKNALKLHSCISHIKSYPGLRHPRHNNIDMAIVFQNVEGEYAGLEHEVIGGVVEMVKIATEDSYRKVVETAFKYAQANDRKTVHAVHAARYFPLVDGLFLKTFLKVAKEYPKIDYKTLTLKTFMSKFILNPENFDVICSPNAYGSGITVAACGMCGGPGLFSCMSVGNGMMVFEPAARKAKLAQNIENPIACLNAAAQMLYYLGYE